MATAGRKLRLIGLVNFAIALAIFLPPVLEHPYPSPFQRYLEWAGFLLLGALSSYHLVLSNRLAREMSEEERAEYRRLMKQ